MAGIYGTPNSVANTTRNVYLAAWLGEWEEVRTIAGSAVLTKDLTSKVVKGALEVTKGDSLINNKAFHLRKLRQMVSICGVRTEYRARTNHVNRRLFCLHGVYLNARSLCTKKNVGLAQYVRFLSFWCIIHYVERILTGAAWVIFRSVQRCEVVVGGLNIRACLNGVAHADKDVFHLLTYLLNEVLSTRTQTTTWKGNISCLSIKLGFKGFSL